MDLFAKVKQLLNIAYSKSDYQNEDLHRLITANEVMLDYIHSLETEIGDLHERIVQLEIEEK